MGDVAQQLQINPQLIDTKPCLYLGLTDLLRRQNKYNHPHLVGNSSTKRLKENKISLAFLKFWLQLEQASDWLSIKVVK